MSAWPPRPTTCVKSATVYERMVYAAHYVPDNIYSFRLCKSQGSTAQGNLEEPRVSPVFIRARPEIKRVIRQTRRLQVVIASRQRRPDAQDDEAGGEAEEPEEDQNPQTAAASTGPEVSTGLPLTIEPGCLDARRRPLQSRARPRSHPRHVAGGARLDKRFEVHVGAELRRESAKRSKPVNSEDQSCLETLIDRREW